jgi:hypothetical protein
MVQTHADRIHLRLRAVGDLALGERVAEILVR